MLSSATAAALRALRFALPLGVLLAAFASLGAAGGASRAHAAPGADAPRPAPAHPYGWLLATPAGDGHAFTRALAPVITATMTDAIVVGDGDGEANPGDRLRYTVVITNTGDTDATGVTLTFGAFVNSSFVAGSGRTTPLALNDAYGALGNTQVAIANPAQGLLANDVDPDDGGAGVTVNVASVTRTGGTVTGSGTLSVNADGTFTYLPPKGETGTETWSYTVLDADNQGSGVPATVTFTIAGPVIWYLDNGAAAGGDGRSTAPFNTVAAFSAVQGAPGTQNPEAGDAIFVADGAGAYAGGLTLLNNQRLVGQGVALAAALGVTPPTGTTLPGATANPVLTNPAGNIVTLAQTNTLTGLTLGDASGIDLVGSGFGTLTVSAVTINGTGRPLSLTNGTLAATFASIAATAAPGGAGILLSNVAGTLTVSGTTSVAGAGAQGISIAGSSLNATFGTATTIGGATTQGILVGTSTGTVSFGNTAVTGGTDGVSLQNNSAGTRTFGTLTVSNTTGGGLLHSVGGGATTVGDVTMPAAGQTAPAGTAIDVQNANANLTFGNVAITKGNAGAGVNLASNAGRTITFASLGVTTSNGVPLSAVSSGTVVVTNNTGALSSQQQNQGLVVTGTAVDMDFASISVVNPHRNTGSVPLRGIDLQNVTGAGITVSGTTAISNSGPAFPSAEGIFISGSSAPFSFGNTTLTALNQSAVRLDANSGAVTFGALNATPGPNARALHATSQTGTVTVSSGTLSTSGAAAIDVTGVSAASLTPLSLSLNSVTASGGTNGVNLTNVSGTASLGTGTLTGAAGGAAFNVVGGSAVITFLGSITQNTANRVVNVQNTTGGSVTLQTGTITGGASSTGVNVTGNAGSVSFANLNLGTSGSRMGATAVTLTNNTSTVGLGVVSIFTTGAGTGIAASGNSGAISTTSGTVNAAGAPAVNVSGPAGLTPLNMSLTTVAANGGANGIFLQNTGTTGSPGGFRVLGTGVAGTGGTIQNISGGDGATAGNGVYLNNTRSVVLNWMNLSGTTNNGLYGTGVRGVLALDRMNFSGTHGTSNSGTFDESVVNLENAGGAITVRNSTLNGGAFNAARVENISGTAPVLDSLVFSNNTVSSMQGSTADVRSTALLVNLLDGTATVRMRQNNLTFWWGNAIHVLAQGTATATTRITGNTAHQTSGALAGAGGIWVAGGNHSYYIGNNSVRGSNGTAISADRTQTGANMNGTINNNQVGQSGVVNSGSATGIGIFASHHGPGTTTVRISNNVIRQIERSANGAITTVTGDALAYGGSGTMNATIVGNNIQESGPALNNAQHGILVTHGIQSGPPNDADIGCYDILSNVIQNFNTAAGAGGQNRIRVNQRFGTTSRFPGYTGAATGATSSTDLATYLLSRNTASNATNANTSTGGFLNTSPPGSPCPQPTMTSLADNAGATAAPANLQVAPTPDLIGAVKVEDGTAKAEALTLSAAADAPLAPASGLVRPAALRLADDAPETAPTYTDAPDLLASADRLESVRLAVEAFAARRAAAAAPERADERVLRGVTSRGDTIVARMNAAGGVDFVIGTLPAGASVTVTFDVDIDDPFAAGTDELSLQGTVTGTNFADVPTNDPDTAAPADPTVTPVIDRRSVPTEVAGTPGADGADEGWRFLSAPVTGVTVADMAAQNLVQGIPGYYDGPVNCHGVPCEPNILTSWSGTAWAAPTGGAHALPPGRGFIWYLYDLTFDPGGPSQSVALPTTLSATGVVASDPVVIPLHATGDRYNLIGNPWPNVLDVSTVTAWADGSVQATLQLWDPIAGTYELSTDPEHNNRLQVWEGAFLENNTATTLSIPASAQIVGPPPEARQEVAAQTARGTTGRDATARGTGRGSDASRGTDEPSAGLIAEEAEARWLAFELRGTDAATNRPTLDAAAAVVFRTDGADGHDRWDATKLTPPTAAHALVAFGAAVEGQPPVLRAQEARPLDPAGSVEIPVHVVARGTAPALTLTWPRLDNVPEAWAVVLRDRVTGEEIDLRERTSYAFSVTPGARAPGGPGAMRAATATGEARFTLVVAPSGVTGTGEGGLPLAFALTGVYPNPARGPVTIGFDIPRPSDVAVEVFDVLGRRVATLADGARAPGRHVVRLDERGLPAGTYLVRLRASAADGSETYERAKAVTVIR